ncbi:MAG TPA: hypothetical protein PK657_05310 [Legionella sp.]|nr:hypothetical protein [Legionella sp.]
MPDYIKTNGQTQVIIPLRVHPYHHEEMFSITGSVFSNEAGTVIYGHYDMEYLLPKGDSLHLIANHNKKNVQLLLLTYDAQLLKLLPGTRSSSLVADTINTLNRYITRARNYKQPLNGAQNDKLHQAKLAIKALHLLLKKERSLNNTDYYSQELLRQNILEIIDNCRDLNRTLANDPLISEGSFGKILYDAYKTAQHYSFNRVFPVARQDQMDFTKCHTSNRNKPCFVWDSELHIGQDSAQLDESLQIICHYYQLNPSAKLTNLPASRFEKIESFITQLWRDSQDWINYLAQKRQTNHVTHVHRLTNGVSLTRISPYYTLKGLTQKGFSSLNEIALHFTQEIKPHLSNNLKEAEKILASKQNGEWAIVSDQNAFLIRIDNRLIQINYFLKDTLYYPLPEGDDLYTLSQLTKRHLYLPERFALQFKAFISRIPSFFRNFYQNMRHFLTDELHQDFLNHIHASHHRKMQYSDRIRTNIKSKARYSLNEALKSKGFLPNGQTIEEFIREQLINSPYIIAQAKHLPGPPPYDNPLHRILGIIRHVGAFFIDSSEKNPLLGTLAMAAYMFGAGAVLNPELLTSVLTKLHLNGLISGIEPTQKLARLMSHGTISETLSASAALWQATITGGSLDEFILDAISALKENPAEIAIIAALAMSLGYGLTQMIPFLKHEMGDFPYSSYAAIGGKGGAALYDTIMHPGEDWLIGTCKWICKSALIIGKLLLGPLIEGYSYGYPHGFLSGLKKSGTLLKKIGVQIAAALTDFSLALLTIPFIELSSLLLHVPFRGVTGFIIKFLSMLGVIQTLGQGLIDFSVRPSKTNFISEFTLSPLYGFTSPFGLYSNVLPLNVFFNFFRIILFPFQLLKNIILLPAFDILSLLTRIVLTVSSPIVRTSAYTSGYFLYSLGFFWDKSLGELFKLSAKTLSQSVNFIDNNVGRIKQHVLSCIEVMRRGLYDWAFKVEDTLIHKIKTDEQYYLTNPQRYELIGHHTTSNCLINHLLNASPTTSEVKIHSEDHNFSILFPKPTGSQEPKLSETKISLIKS